MTRISKRFAAGTFFCTCLFCTCLIFTVAGLSGPNAAEAAETETAREETITAKEKCNETSEEELLDSAYKAFQCGQEPAFVHRFRDAAGSG